MKKKVEKLDLAKLKKAYHQFADDRNWKDFHSPKNLVMALSVEAAELVEIFQWLNEEQSRLIKNDPEGKEMVEDEVADVFLYLNSLCTQLDIDLAEAIERKQKKNAVKYPIKKGQKMALTISKRYKN